MEKSQKTHNKISKYFFAIFQQKKSSSQKKSPKNENDSIMVTTHFRRTFFQNFFRLFKNGHFFCPKSKTQFTFWKKVVTTKIP
jgi:regulation of enolase protein 1 (concanavalin A-like superfamily)